MIVILIVSFGFGASLVSTIKEETLNFKLLYDVISSVYWLIYGEMNFRDSIDQKMVDSSYDDYGAIYAFFLFMIYALAVILLVNLLIAMFKYFMNFFLRKKSKIFLNYF